MSTPLFLLILAALAALAYVIVAVTAYRQMRGVRVVTCPESGQPAAVTISGTRAVLSAIVERSDLHVAQCSRWPDRSGCNEACSKQVAAAPRGTLALSMAQRWYAGKTCALCLQLIATPRAAGSQPGMLNPALTQPPDTISWRDAPPEALASMFATHLPVCARCHEREQFGVPAMKQPRTAAGRTTRHARFVWPAVLLATLALQFPVSASAVEDEASGKRQDVSLRQDGDVFTVTATFDVPHAASLATAVLTDYEHISRFMPGVTRSVVLQRQDGRTVVEQEAVARLLMFSKRVYLLLEVHEEEGIIRFADRSGRSFSRYEGSWRLTANNGRTAIVYELTAKPSFDVPEFVLGRLLKRDAKKMIEGLRQEMDRRGKASAAIDAPARNEQDGL